MENIATACPLPKKRNRHLDPFTKSATAIEIRDAGLNMTTLPEMRDLAQRLLAYEANAGESTEPIEPAILCVYERLRQSLSDFAGTAAFQSLAYRALAMARAEVPSLRAARVGADGALTGLGHGLGQGMSEFGPQIDPEKDRAGEHQAADEGIVVIARLLGLLLTFLGEPITLRLLRNTWPGATFDDRSSEKGKKA
jgi:hypothetical protein